MRRSLALLGLLILGGCQDEPSFDDRYANAQREIRARADAIDNQLANASASAEQ